MLKEFYVLLFTKILKQMFHPQKHKFFDKKSMNQIDRSTRRMSRRFLSWIFVASNYSVLKL